MWTAAVDVVICATLSLSRWRIPCPARVFINLSERCRNNISGNKRTDDKLLAHGVFWQAGVFRVPCCLHAFWVTLYTAQGRL